MTSKANAPYPYLGINGEYLDKDFLDSVWDELQRKSASWLAGIDTPSVCDRFAYTVMKQITTRMPS